jgi:hypothetical protein
MIIMFHLQVGKDGSGRLPIEEREESKYDTKTLLFISVIIRIYGRRNIL